MRVIDDSVLQEAFEPQEDLARKTNMVLKNLRLALKKEMGFNNLELDRFMDIFLFILNFYMERGGLSQTEYEKFYRFIVPKMDQFLA